MSESVQSAWLSCGALDVISLHAYGVGDFATASLRQYVTEVQNAGKKLLMEEWGACYFTTENNNCPQGSVLGTATRNANIKAWADQINAAGLSWLYWQVLPNADPHVSALAAFVSWLFGTDEVILWGWTVWERLRGRDWRCVLEHAPDRGQGGVLDQCSIRLLRVSAVNVLLSKWNRTMYRMASPVLSWVC